MAAHHPAVGAVLPAVGEKRNRDTAAASERRVQPRHFHAGPNPQPGNDSEEELQDPAASLAKKLHRHALESVFAFCSLSELSTLLSVSHDWQSAVLSMKPLEFDQSRVSTVDELALICASPLRRHEGIIGDFDDNAGEYTLHLHPSLLQLLSFSMPHLCQLTVSVDTSATKMYLPAGLIDLGVELSLRGSADPTAAASAAQQFNSLLSAAARLKRLQGMHVVTEHWSPNCSFAALARAPTLRSFIILPSVGGSTPSLTDAQVHELRALSQLDLFRLYGLDEPVMLRLLVQPHSLRWRELDGFFNVTAKMAELLCSLPLRTLDASLLDMPHADFLASMPKLTTLKLGSANTKPMDSARVFRTLGQCVQLQSLTLSGGGTDHALRLSNEHLASCLPSLSSLHSLIIQTAAHLTTLSFLTLGKLPRTLTSLELSDFDRRLPPIEVKHLLSLRKLFKLHLINVFDKELSAETLLLFQPPVQPTLMPELTAFEHQWTAAAAPLAAAV